MSLERLSRARGALKRMANTLRAQMSQARREPYLVVYRRYCQRWFRVKIKYDEKDVEHEMALGSRWQ